MSCFGDPAIAWFSGPSLLRAIDQLEAAESAAQQRLRFPVQDVYRVENRRVLVGRIGHAARRRSAAFLASPQNGAGGDDRALADDVDRVRCDW